MTRYIKSNSVIKLHKETNMNVIPALEAIEKLKKYLLEHKSDSNYQELLEHQKLSMKMSKEIRSLNVQL